MSSAEKESTAEDHTGANWTYRFICKPLHSSMHFRHIRETVRVELRRLFDGIGCCHLELFWCLEVGAWRLFVTDEYEMPPKKEHSYPVTGTPANFP